MQAELNETLTEQASGAAQGRASPFSSRKSTQLSPKSSIGTSVSCGSFDVNATAYLRVRQNLTLCLPSVGANKGKEMSCA